MATNVIFVTMFCARFAKFQKWSLYTNAGIVMKEIGCVEKKYTSLAARTTKYKGKIRKNLLDIYKKYDRFIPIYFSLRLATCRNLKL